VTVAPFATTTTALGLTASGLPSSQGTSLTFTATVTGSTPTGNVSFYNGATLLNTSALNSAFQASFTIILAPSSHKITARYTGDTANEASASAVFTTQPILAPTPPLNLVARSGSNSVLLTWTAVAQATDYRVKRSLTSGGPYTTINVAYSSAFTDNSAVDGTTYYYVVTASNSLGESANSSSVNAKPYTPSSAKNIQTFVFPGLPATTFSGTDIRVKVKAGTVVTGLSPAYTISPLATGSPVSGAARDFTFPQIYTIKAEDFTTKAYSVTVAVNQPPVAAAQTISVGIDTTKPITLTGTDADGDVLDYIIVTSPLNGTLGGTSPNRNYKPNSNYSGADSFTYKVNDGMNDSAVVRVDLAVTPLTFTWNSAIAGNWSDGSKWTVGTSPSSVGIESYVLNFNVLGTYTATHDLGAGFLLNRLNFGGSTVVLAGNGLALAANGSNLPQVNQDSASMVTLSTPLGLAANTTLGGNGSGALTLSGIISGSGSLTKTSSGDLTLSGVNTYAGGTTVSRGILLLENINGLGTGPLTMVAGTTFKQLGFEGNGSTGAVPNAIVLSGAGNVIMAMSFEGRLKDIWLSQPISGTGGFTVEGAGRSLTLAANNTFSGGIKLTGNGNNVKIAHNNALGSGVFRTEPATAGTGNLESIANLSALPGVPNPFNIAPGAYLNVLVNGINDLLLSGPITSANGIGNLHKSGSARLTLAGVNTYTGTTTVAAGILSCNSATALGQGPVVINGGKLDLNYPGTRQVASLSLGGVLQANGSYGSSTSPATFANNTYFSGVGTVIVGPINTTTTVASNLNPATVGAAVTFTATVTGRTPTGNVSFYIGNTLLGTSALNSSFQASITASSLAIGGFSITASYAGSTNNSASSSPSLNQQVTGSPYDTWASDSVQGMAAGVNRGAMDDPDKDGIPNVIEFVLGGAPMSSSQAPLPTLTKSGNQLVFTYNRSKAAQNSISQIVEYGSDLIGWTQVIIPATSANSVTITPGALSDRVTVTIPNLGTKIFIRLKVSK
jgi:autotransporter-associated beta strand protein